LVTFETFCFRQAELCMPNSSLFVIVAVRQRRLIRLKMRRLFILFAAMSLAAIAWADFAGAEDRPNPTPNSADAELPRVFLLDAHRLQASRQKLAQGDPALKAAAAKLKDDAAKALVAGPFSVVEKDYTPPSGDKHDYMSQAPYFWPDANQAEGTPYIRRDGQRNPEINKYRNHQSMSRMADAVDTLALAYYYTGDEADAVRAAKLLRAWFLDADTKMNPHLQYAQAIPGVNTGRGIGLIESICLTRVVDAIGLLHGSAAWTSDDQRGMEDWYGKFLAWMLESRNGKDEAAAKNNHGTYYDVQVASYAFFLGKNDVAKAVLENAGVKRIAVQVEPNGRQPLELARTKAWSYSVSNLQGLISLAKLGEHVDVDLWNFQTADGRSIRKAIEFLCPFAAGEQPWTYEQLGGWTPQGMTSVLRPAIQHYPDERFRTVLEKLTAKESNTGRESLR
jgi:hypothetical protein